VFVVCCPKDLTMFEDALKTSGYEGKFVVRELIELVAESLADAAGDGPVSDDQRKAVLA
jgi:hypothetical protein